MTDHDPLAAFAALLTEEGRTLLAEARDTEPAQELAVATRLRRDHDPALVTAVLAQVRLRQRAVAKFGARDAYRMFFTPDGVEQATRTTVAAYRAARFRTALGAAGVLDLCCGIGGDAIGFARAGIAVRAVDRDPLTCAAARANMAAVAGAAEVTVECGDVAEVEPGAAQALFVDPARRGGRGRIFDPEAYSPPLSWSLDALRRVGAGALKIAPGIPHELIPDDVEAEWISDGGEVKEAVLWHDARQEARHGERPGGAAAPAGPPGHDGPADTAASDTAAPDTTASDTGASDTTDAAGPSRAAGPAATASAVVHGTRRATLLPSGATLTGRGLSDPGVREPGRFLYEPDGAVIRAHLVAEAAAELDGGLLDATIAYITADELRPTAYATAYEITDVLPFGLKRLKALLREREVGTLTVKKRGSAIGPEELRRRVKPRGPRAATVFLTRVAGAPAMLIGHPAVAAPGTRTGRGTGPGTGQSRSVSSSA